MNNCFELAPPYRTWTFQIPAGRGGRREITTKGMWVIQHESTGKYIAGVSNNVSADIDAIIKRLVEGTHPNKHLCALVKLDPELKLFEVACDNAKVAKAKLIELLRSTQPTYCNLTQ